MNSMLLVSPVLYARPKRFRRYEITVNDYETWKLYMDELKSIDGVEKVSPSLFYGKKQGLK